MLQVMTDEPGFRHETHSTVESLTPSSAEEARERAGEADTVREARAEDELVRAWATDWTTPPEVGEFAAVMAATRLAHYAAALVARLEQQETALREAREALRQIAEVPAPDGQHLIARRARAVLEGQ